MFKPFYSFRYVLVLLQEITRMNVLLSYIKISLDELEKGLNGELNMSQAMEHLGEALSINQTPGRNPFHKTSWEALAWWSRKVRMAHSPNLLKNTV